jgi:DNA-binding transcriptional MerR regulator
LLDGTRIGQLAEATAVSARSLRYNEASGLITSQRTSGGWRNFDDTMVDRVVLIQNLFAAGLCSSTIGELLPCLVAPADERTGALEQRLAREVARLEAVKRDVDRQLEVLHSLVTENVVTPSNTDHR